MTNKTIPTLIGGLFAMLFVNIIVANSNAEKNRQDLEYQIEQYKLKNRLPL